MIARLLLRKIFRTIGEARHGHTLRVEFSDGSIYQNHTDARPNDAVITFRTAASEWYTLVFFYQGLFESYIEGYVDLAGDRPIAALSAMGRAAGFAAGGLWERLGNPLIGARQLLQEWRQSNTDRERAIRNAEHHYALHPAMFEYMLGDTVGYSEGLWTSDTKTLDEAKYNAYEYVCRKLRLAPGLKVLEVGPGWGFMPIHMVKRYGVDVTVYNPVRRQNEYMRERFARHGVSDRIRLIEADHRDIAKEPGSFDRFVSIGVHEHCGWSRRQYRLWAHAIAAALKEGGIELVSTTSFMGRYMTNFLILKYIFPGGHLPSLPHTLIAFDRAGLMLVEVENLWPHYRRTVEQWRSNFARHWPRIEEADPAAFTERFRRAWMLYLEGTSESFTSALDLCHILFTKGRGADYYPRLDGSHPRRALPEESGARECYR